MPQKARCNGRLKACALLFALMTLAWLAPSAGCRALRSRQSDDDMAAARQLSLQGLDAQGRGHWDRAETLFAAAILKCPSDERARCGYAESLWQRGERGLAIQNMEEAVQLSGYDPQRLMRLGAMYLAQGDAARARQQADRALEANAQLAGAWALRGQAQHAARDFEAALASYHRALSFEPFMPEIQMAVADIYVQQNRPQRALATLQTLADRFPPGRVPPEVLQREALALRALGRSQDATRALAEAGDARESPDRQVRVMPAAAIQMAR